jgi:uncharacterized protein (DUF58 family)
MKIFNVSSLRKLEQLNLVADRVRVGVMKGELRSRKRGTSIEFADYRNYTQGDDLRRLDWNVFARLERPFIKLLEEEEDLGVHLLVDTSLSMDWPDEDEELNKLNDAIRLAGALAHIGLAAGDQVTVTLLNSNANARWGPYRGRHNTLRLLQFLENGRASGITDLNLVLRNYALQGRRPGLLFVLSDLFSPGGYREGLSALQSRGYEVGLLHILSHDETDPPIGGDVKLVDIETGADAEITLDNSTLSLYRERFQDWQAEIMTHCQNRGIHYVPITTDYPWERLVMQTLRVKGIVS